MAAAGAVGLAVALVAVFFVPGEYGYVEGPVNMWLSVLPFYGISLYLYVRRREHLVAQLLLATGSALCILTGLSGELSLIARDGGDPPLLWLQTLFLQWATFGFAAGLAATFVAFPDERIDDALRRWTLRALAGLTFLGPLLLAVSRRELYLEPALLRPRPAGTSPLFVEALAGLAPLAEWATDNAPSLYIIGIVALLIRRDRGVTALQQVQLRWMTAAGLLYGIFFVSTTLAVSAGALSPGVNAAAPCLLFFPVAIAISVLRHQLLDVEVVIRKSLLYGALTVGIGLAIAGLAALLGVTVGARIPFGAAVAVTAALMLVFQPLRRRLEAAADRWVFGERVSGFQLLTRFGATLEHAYDLTELAPRLAAATVDGLGVRWARVEVCLTGVDDRTLELLGAAGEETDADPVAATTVPLVHAGELVGVLSCGPKIEGPLTADDRELLSTLGRQAALGIHNARLAAELAGRIDEIHRQADELTASRTRIVQAQDTERRRIERNIHDGAQQEIVALIAKLRLARNQMARADGRADATLAELQDDARLLLGDLRELAHGIHPPILTDRGLFEALDARASRADLPIAVHAEAELRRARFSDDVEGAAFFFASEAMTNALKHAKASRIDVRLSRVEMTLLVDVEDDGVGFVPADGAAAGGVGDGLANMRDRVEALGGKLRIASTPGRGSRVRAEFPVSLEVGHVARSDR